MVRTHYTRSNVLAIEDTLYYRFGGAFDDSDFLHAACHGPGRGIEFGLHATFGDAGSDGVWSMRSVNENPLAAGRPDGAADPATAPVAPGSITGVSYAGSSSRPVLLRRHHGRCSARSR